MLSLLPGELFELLYFFTYNIKFIMPEERSPFTFWTCSCFAFAVTARPCLLNLLSALLRLGVLFVLRDLLNILGLLDKALFFCMSILAGDEIEATEAIGDRPSIVPRRDGLPIGLFMRLKKFERRTTFDLRRLLRVMALLLLVEDLFDLLSLLCVFYSSSCSNMFSILRDK